MTPATLDIWINRRPEDELADAIAAADRRATMDALKLNHHVVVDDPAAPSAVAGECGWCPKRRQLASMPDGASRLPQFGRLVASPANRRVVGEPCDKCVRTALGTIKRRVDASHKDSGGVVRSTKDSGEHKGTSRLDGHHVNRTTPPDRFTKMHDPLGTCSTCQEYRRLHPDVVLTAGGVPEGCAPHPWNEQPRPPTWAR